MNWTIANMAAAAFAVVVNLTAAWLLSRSATDDAKPWRSLFVWTAAFSAFYSVWYGVREWGGWDPADWSNAVIPFGTIAFLTVWTLPATLAASQHVIIRRQAKWFVSDD